MEPDRQREAVNPPISDAEAAAVMVMLIDEEQASQILAQFERHELQLLGEKMCALGEIGPQTIVQAIKGFVERAGKQGIGSEGRVNKVRGLMTRAVGDVKAENLMARIAPEEAPVSSLELARWLNASALAPMIAEEHPQAIAVLLSQIDSDVASQVLQALSPDQQTEVVHRIATMRPVSGEAIAMLEELLSRRLALAHGHTLLKMGGAREAAEIINASGKVFEKRVIPEIARRDKQLARKIESEMFKFEHLFALDPQSMGALLREVESDTLINALKGIEEAQRDNFFHAMSSRAADGVRDEIAARGRLRMADVLDAQKAIIALARRLADEGVIAFGSAGDDEYV